MSGNKFKAGELVRIGGPDGRMPERYPHIDHKGRIVKILEVLPKQFSNSGSGYVIAGRRGYPHSVLAAWELRKLDERIRRPGAGRKPRASDHNGSSA